jgi:hypothetical protein
MTEEAHAPGPLEEEKRGETADPAGLPQPEAAEVESAALLANEAREALEAEGLDEREIRRLADAYIAQDRGTDLSAFLDWARAQGRSADS